MKILFRWLPILVLSLTGKAFPGQLDSAIFQKLHSQLQPNPGESWRRIPWKISVLEAQRLAAREHKPLFIWAMDGHPLGCT